MSARISKIKQRRESVWSIEDLAWVVVIFVIFGYISTRLGTDGTPDFKIYHFYNGYSVQVDRSQLDIFPAALQTAYFPGLDAIYYLIFRALNEHPKLLNVVLSVPYGIAACAIFFTTQVFVPASFRFRSLFAAAAAIAGLTGAAALPTMATTMSDIVPAVPVLIAICLWVNVEARGGNSIRSAAAIGAIGGLSVGLKLTLVPIFIGLFLVTLFDRGPRSVFRPWQGVIFGLAGVIVFFAMDSLWLWSNWTRYGDPIFPYMNNIFRSDLVDPSPFTDTRFMPKTVLMALIYPAFWAFDLSTDAIELNMRDPRVLIGCISAMVVVVSYAKRCSSSGSGSQVDTIERIGAALATMFLVSFVLWEKVWSIYRYLAVQEALSCLILLLALLAVARSSRRYRSLLAIFLVAVAAIVGSTAYPWWSRAQSGPVAMSISLPPIEADAMVVFLDRYAYSYLVPEMPRTVRAIGANSNLVNPTSRGTLEKQIEETIRNHDGPIWGFEYPKVFPGAADGTLAHHHLERTADCDLLKSSIEEQEGVKICRLKRVP